MSDRPPLLIFDVESLGLHGEGYAWGVVLIENGEVTEEALAWCHPDQAAGEPADRKWAAENVLPKLLAATGSPTHKSVQDVREEFWSLWDGFRNRFGGSLMADCTWPVEANFLSACIRDDLPMRVWNGPYPLLDAATLRIAGLATPTEDDHEPLEDARRTWLSVEEWWTGA